MMLTLTGNNDYARRTELDRIIATFASEHGDIAIERLDGEEAPADQMRGAVQSPPFLSSRKLVILREPGKQKLFAEHIAEILKDVAESTDLVIYEPKLDKRSTYYKTLKKETDYVECGELDAAKLTTWMMTYVATMGGTLKSADARLLLDRVGSNQQMLQSEIDKLLAYSPAITNDTIMLLTELAPQSTIFELLDAAFAGNKERAFQIYREQRALKVEPQAIIAMLAWQLHILAVVKAGGKKSVDEIASAAKINPFVIRKSQGILRRLTLAYIKTLIHKLLTLDLQLKKSSIDADEAVQLYLLQLTRPAE